MPLWYGAWSAAEDWGVPPWEIMGEQPTQWTKIKWVMRNNFIKGEMSKRAERDAKRAKRKHGGNR